MIKFEVVYSPENHAVIIRPISGKQDPRIHFDAVVNLQYALSRFFLAADPEFYKILKDRSAEIIIPQMTNPITFPYESADSASIE